MKFERTEVYGIENAIYGMRLPKMSHDKMDSYTDQDTKKFHLGENDLNLCQRLIKAGSEHRKFMRQIGVSVTITAPLHLLKELDTYKVGTVSNSSSTMHKLASTPITMDCFELDDYCGDAEDLASPQLYIDDFVKEELIPFCETLRQKYLETRDKRYWKELIRWLPESWLQTRTITMNYENLYSIVRQRKGHKLTEWKAFIEWAKTLPYAKELIFCGLEGI